MEHIYTIWYEERGVVAEADVVAIANLDAEGARKLASFFAAGRGEHVRVIAVANQNTDQLVYQA